MIIGRIFGKITTLNFSFLVQSPCKKYDFVQVYHPLYDFVLCQIMEIERTDKDIAKCNILGYKDKSGQLKSIRVPFDKNSEVLLAQDEFIKNILNINVDNSKYGAILGNLDGKSNIPITLDLSKVLTKHISVLAKSGSGKSYTIGVLLEEILNRKIPVLVIDPHGEYNTLSKPNTNENDKLKLSNFNLEPKGFNVLEFSNLKTSKNSRPIKLPNSLTTEDIRIFLPKLSSNQQATLMSALKRLDSVNIQSLLYSLDQEESNGKWNIINNLEYIEKFKLFSDHISYNDFLKSGQCSIINLKGVDVDLQQIIVYKLVKDLFELRKTERIPPFFLVIEEAHNFAPERSFGEAKSSKILRTVASEGRKFGMGLCLISQRPARVDKSVLSQCSTQIVMKVTNPNDLKAIINSTEGLDNSTAENIKSLPIGSAFLAGVVDMPLLINIRPRQSKHGGEAVSIIDISEEDNDLLQKLETYENKDILPLISPNISKKDLILMTDKKIRYLKTILKPCYQVVCKDKYGEYVLLLSDTGKLIIDKDSLVEKQIPQIKSLTKREIKVLQTAFRLKQFTKDKIEKDYLDELETLLIKGYINLTNTGVSIKTTAPIYSLSDKFIYSKLIDYSNYDKVEYMQIEYDDKHEHKLTSDEIIKTLNSFTNVLDIITCYLITYKPVFD